MSELPDRHILDNLLTRLGDAELIINNELRVLQTLRREVSIAKALLDFDQKHAITGIVPLSIIERRAVYDAMAFCKGDKMKAAERLGIGKTTLYRKLKEYEEVKRFAA